jgi:anti-sigma factor RsiW
MKRKAILIAVAAAAAAAIVVLSTGAVAGTGGPSDQPPDFAAFVSCLSAHRVQVPSDDPAAVKPWLGDHQSDPAVQGALQACAPAYTAGRGKPSGGAEPAPTAGDLVACLEQHGVDVPSDVKQTPDALKPWLAGAVQQPTVQAALDECAAGPGQNGKNK